MSNKICIVTLVSDQTAPNVIFLKWCVKKYGNDHTRIVLVSTEKMEQKDSSTHIKNALEPYQALFANPLKVDEYDIEDIKNTLSGTINVDDYEQVIVNITGGTKIMSLAVYLYFHTKHNVCIFYQAFGKPALQQLYPAGDFLQFGETITVREYFKAYGIQANYTNSCIKNWEFNRKVLPLLENNHDMRNLLTCMQNIRKVKKKFEKKTYLDITTFDYDVLQQEIKNDRFPADIVSKAEMLTKENVSACISQFGFDDKKLKNSELRYITGGWFEEYVYQKIKYEQGIADENIALNVQICIKDTKNELDVVYIDNRNALHIIECKSFIDETEQSELLSNTLYKIQALRSQCGLSARPELYTMSEITKESPLGRAKTFDITIKDRSKMLNACENCE